MKIAFIVSTFPALPETFILDQITGLIDLGCDIHIYSRLTPPVGKIHSDVEKYKLYSRLYPLDRTPSKKLVRILKTLKLLGSNLHILSHILFNSLNVFKCRRESYPLRLLYHAVPFLGKRYDVIHCHFGPNGNLGVLLKQIGVKGKLITAFHGYDANSYVRANGKDVYKSLFQTGDLFTVNTNFTKKKVIELGCKESKIVLLPEGLNLENYQFSESFVNERRSDIKILTVARLVEKKGLEYSIRAIAKVKEKCLDFEYWIIGDGPLKSKLVSLVKELNLSDYVKFMGWRERNEVIRCYRKSAIFMLASVTSRDGDQEGQGLVLQEAQAMGLPVVSTLHNGIPEGVQDGKTGFLVPERDVDALADRLVYLIENPDIRFRMGMAGRKFVENRYDIRKLNKLLLNIYEDVCDDYGSGAQRYE